MTLNGSGWATPEQAADAAKDWNIEILECRANRHGWQRESATFIKKYRYYRLLQRCFRCQSTRYQEMSMAGNIYVSRINYSSEYLAKGIGRIAGDAMGQVRLEMVNRDGVDTITSTKDGIALPHSKVTQKALGIEA